MLKYLYIFIPLIYFKKKTYMPLYKVELYEITDICLFDPQKWQFHKGQPHVSNVFLKDIQETVHAVCLWRGRASNVKGRYNCNHLNKFLYFYFSAEKVMKIFEI